MFIFWRSVIYAIVESGGKQYRVAPGQTINIERLGITEGEAIELDKVLLIADDEKLTVGQPVIDGAKVVATSKGEFRDKKVVVFKYKPKVRYSKKTGHRQSYTRLTIDSILAPGAAAAKPKTTRRTKKEVVQDGA